MTTRFDAQRLAVGLSFLGLVALLPGICLAMPASVSLAEVRPDRAAEMLTALYGDAGIEPDAPVADCHAHPGCYPRADFCAVRSTNRHPRASADGHNGQHDPSDTARYGHAASSSRDGACLRNRNSRSHGHDGGQRHAMATCLLSFCNPDGYGLADPGCRGHVDRCAGAI